MIDKERFHQAIARVIGEEQGASGIGTLSERTLHRVLKYYFEEDSDNHEVAYLGAIADIKNSEGIIEIQTGSFSHLSEKLGRFLPSERVTVVYPLVVKKRIKWLDKDTGELTDSKREVRGKVLADCGRELYAIRKYIGAPGLTLKILGVCAIEYRCLDGYGKTRKNRASKLNTVPERITFELTLSEKRDYLALLPEGLGEEFTAKDFSRASGSRSRFSGCILRLLCELGVLERQREGRAYKYKTVKHQR